MPTTRKPLAVRFPADLEERIRALAGERGQALNKIIVELVERGLSIGTVQTTSSPTTANHAPLTRSATKLKTGKAKKRTVMCEHRRQPDEFCSRCDA